MEKPSAGLYRQLLEDIRNWVKSKCVACGGTGRSSKGGTCSPCNGTGRIAGLIVDLGHAKVQLQEVEPYVEPKRPSPFD